MARKAGLAAIAGHNWPVFLNFSGGRGVLTALSVVVALTPWLALPEELFKKYLIVENGAKEKMLVKVDRSQLNQVIINLVINAVDAMDRKGTLTLRTFWHPSKKKGAGKKGAAGFAYLEVADTGCGISGENLSRIFDPFFTTKELGKGTGLGLSTTYGIIHENGGTIWVKETSPKGTTFIVELPLCQDANGHEL